MAHAARGIIHGHPGFSHNAHHGGWWKFGLVALIATVLGVTFVYSPLLRDSDQAAQPAPAAPIVLGPAAPVITLPTFGAAPNQIQPPVQAVEPARPAVASATANEAVQPAIPAPLAVKAQASSGIRDVDFATLPVLQALARQLAGRVDKAQVRFADLTGDGSDEAIVPITSDGSYGNLAVVVLMEKDGVPQAVLTRLAGRERRGLVLVFDRGQLTETSGVYGPFDANCCPSQLVKTYFRWDGNSLVVDRTETITIPPGKQTN